MHSLEVSDGLATVGPGFRLGDLYAALASHEVTIPAGCGATVGIGGQALGGGLGLLGPAGGSRRIGWSRHRWYWPTGGWWSATSSATTTVLGAARRGRRGVGVVTRLTLRTLSEPAATAFHLKWPYERASALIAAWQEWSPTGPDGLAASLLVTVGGEAGAVPVVHLFGSLIGSETETALLDEFVSVAGAEPASSEHAQMRYGSLKSYLAERGRVRPGGRRRPPLHEVGVLPRAMPAGAVEALVERFVRGRRPGEARKLDFMPWSGAYNRVPPGATAFPHRQELFLLEQVVVLPAGFDAVATEAARAWLSDSWELVPVRLGRRLRELPGCGPKRRGARLLG